MSTYITIYCQDKTTPAGPYTELDSWSRSSQMFQVLNDLVDFEKTAQLTGEKIDAAIAAADREIEYYENMKKREKERLELVKSAAVNVEDLMEFYDSYVDSMEKIEEEIKAFKRVKVELEMFSSFIGNAEFCEHGAHLFVSYEDNPNFQENEKEEL